MSRGRNRPTGSEQTHDYQVRAELLLRAGDRIDEAAASLNQALAVARQQGAKAYELRAATSLARLWGEKGRRAEAHDLLAPIYGWFTEGFNTADLKEAKGCSATALTHQSGAGLHGLTAGGGSQLRTRLGSQIREPRPNGSIPRGLGTILGAVRAEREITGQKPSISAIFGCQFPAYQSRAHARASGRFSARGPKAPTPPAGQAG